jgi:hypothetical protein
MKHVARLVELQENEDAPAGGCTTSTRPVLDSRPHVVAELPLATSSKASLLSGVSSTPLTLLCVRLAISATPRSNQDEVRGGKGSYPFTSASYTLDS